MDDGENTENTSRRLSLTFHRTFSLSRTAISDILLVTSSTPLSRKTLSTGTKLGSIYLEAMPRYGIGSGLLQPGIFQTEFGNYAKKFDPLLDQTSTQWLMHYHLSAPQGPGPAFWHALISTLFYAGAYFKAEDIADAIGNFVWQSENRTLASRSVQSTATIFLGTYTKPEGLNKLRLLETTESGRYRVCEPTPAPTWAIAYALVDFWMANYPKRLGIGIDVLLDSSFPKLFLIGRKRLVEVLEAMQEIGYVQLHRTAPPHQVVLIRQDTEGLLNKLYGTQ